MSIVNLLFQQELEEGQKKKLDKRYSNEQLRQIYLDTKKSGIYNYISEIPSDQIIVYFFIIFIAYHLMNKFLFFNAKNLILFIASFIIIFLYNERRRSVNISKMQELELKLESIYPTPKYFYLDSGIIEIIYSIKDLENYNKPEYERAIKILDKFLKLTLEIEIEESNAEQYLDLMLTGKQEILNCIQSIVHSLPGDKVVDMKLTDALESLHYALNFHIENVRQLCNERIKKNGYNTSSRPIHTNKMAVGSDQMFDQYYDFY